MEWYGSLQNRLMERTTASEIKIGTGVTECLWSDRHAWEVIAIKDEKHITIRRLDYKMVEGTDWLDQEYEYFSNPDGQVINLYKTKSGWRERIGRNGLGDTRFSVGYASEYRDPSF